MMGRIHKIVRQVLTSGCLTCETEESLRQLLATYYDLDDIEALTLLQRALRSGSIRQESRQISFSAQAHRKNAY